MSRDLPSISQSPGGQYITQIIALGTVPTSMTSVSVPSASRSSLLLLGRLVLTAQATPPAWVGRSRRYQVWPGSAEASSAVSTVSLSQVSVHAMQS